MANYEEDDIVSCSRRDQDKTLRLLILRSPNPEEIENDDRIRSPSSPKTVF